MPEVREKGKDKKKTATEAVDEVSKSMNNDFLSLATRYLLPVAVGIGSGMFAASHSVTPEGKALSLIVGVASGVVAGTVNVLDHGR